MAVYGPEARAFRSIGARLREIAAELPNYSQERLVKALIEVAEHSEYQVKEEPPPKGFLSWDHVRENYQAVVGR
jgi:hypothetical protein